MILDARAQVDGVDGLTDLLESVDFDDMLQTFAARRSSFEEFINNFATAASTPGSAAVAPCNTHTPPPPPVASHPTTSGCDVMCLFVLQVRRAWASTAVMGLRMN